jgi:hypothetical protein
MIEFIKMEVVWNEGQNFSTVREKLDKFSTFAPGAKKGRILADPRRIASRGMGDDAGIIELASCTAGCFCRRGMYHDKTDLCTGNDWLRDADVCSEPRIRVDAWTMSSSTSASWGC